MNEAEAILIVCAFLGGEPNVTHKYTIDDGPKIAFVDCETETHAIEVGLDKRSSLDSVQQASFYSWLAGKEPMVLLIDTDGTEGTIEYRVEAASRRFGIEYRVYTDNFLIRWQIGEYFRQRRDEIADR